MEQWEYFSTFIEANAHQHFKELQAMFPDGGNIGVYSPLALIPQLNEYGAQGWELVTCQPVAPGTNSDVLIQGKTGLAGMVFAHHYFCVFKRRKPDSSPPQLGLR